MNKHIEVVKKWLADPQSVTQAELEANAKAANAARAAADATAVAAAMAADAAWAAAWAAAMAADAAWAAAARATYWVKQYEEITNA